MRGKAVRLHRRLYRGRKPPPANMRCGLEPCSPKMQQESACQSGYCHVAQPDLLSQSTPLGHSISTACSCRPPQPVAEPLAAHLEGAPRLFDDVNALQVAAALEPHDGIHCQLSKVLLLLCEDLGAAGREGRILRTYSLSACRSSCAGAALHLHAGFCSCRLRCRQKLFRSCNQV